MKRKRAARHIEDVGWGSRAAQFAPPGMVSIALIVLSVLILLGIYSRAKVRAELLQKSEAFLVAWQHEDYAKLKGMYGNLGAVGIDTPDEAFLPSPELREYRVPESSQEKEGNISLPIVFTPTDWKGRTSPWIIDLSRIRSFEMEQFYLGRRQHVGAASATVLLDSNQGMVKRRVVIVFLTESARRPIIFAQIIPPGKLSIFGF